MNDKTRESKKRLLLTLSVAGREAEGSRSRSGEKGCFSVPQRRSQIDSRPAIFSSWWACWVPRIRIVKDEVQMRCGCRMVLMKVSGL